MGDADAASAPLSGHLSVEVGQGLVGYCAKQAVITNDVLVWRESADSGEYLTDSLQHFDKDVDETLTPQLHP